MYGFPRERGGAFWPRLPFAPCFPAIRSSPPNPSTALILGVKAVRSTTRSPAAAGRGEEAWDARRSFAPGPFPGESQAPVVDAVTARNPTITIISPADANGVTRPLKQDAARGTKIITVDPLSPIRPSSRARSSPRISTEERPPPQR